MQDQAALREAGEELGPQGDEASEVVCALLAPLHKKKNPNVSNGAPQGSPSSPSRSEQIDGEDAPPALPEQRHQFQTSGLNRPPSLVSHDQQLRRSESFSLDLTRAQHRDQSREAGEPPDSPD